LQGWLIIGMAMDTASRIPGRQDTDEMDIPSGEIALDSKTRGFIGFLIVETPGDDKTVSHDPIHIVRIELPSSVARDTLNRIADDLDAGPLYGTCSIVINLRIGT